MDKNEKILLENLEKLIDTEGNIIALITVQQETNTPRWMLIIDTKNNYLNGIEKFAEIIEKFVEKMIPTLQEEYKLMNKEHYDKEFENKTKEEIAILLNNDVRKIGENILNSIESLKNLCGSIAKIYCKIAKFYGITLDFEQYEEVK